MESDLHEITTAILSVRAGNPGASERLIEVLHPELRRLASTFMSQTRFSEALTLTSIVQKVLLRLNDGKLGTVQNRAHFLSVASIALRLVLMDHAKSRRRERKVDGGHTDPALLEVEAKLEELVEVDALLKELELRDQSAARVVELKFFGGLTDREAALVLGSSVAGIRRDWEFGRSWLRVRLTESRREDGSEG
jgi:RNA polymerase sigma-70 factor (ECF subfamily)